MGFSKHMSFVYTKTYTLLLLCVAMCRYDLGVRIIQTGGGFVCPLGTDRPLPL